MMVKIVTTRAIEEEGERERESERKKGRVLGQQKNTVGQSIH
jgi:hypothetical protein